MGALGIFYIIFLILFYIIIRVVCRPRPESQSEDQPTENARNQHSSGYNQAVSTRPTANNHATQNEADIEFINHLRQQNVSRQSPTTTTSHHSSQVPTAPQSANNLQRNLQEQFDSPPCYEDAIKQLPQQKN